MRLGGVVAISLLAVAGGTGSAVAQEEGEDSAIAGMVRGFLNENTNFRFVEEELAGIQVVDPIPFDNFAGPGTPPALDVSSVEIQTIFMASSGEPDDPDQLLADTFSFDALPPDLNLAPDAAASVLLAATEVTPEGMIILQDHAFGRSQVLPPLADLVVRTAPDPGLDDAQQAELDILLGDIASGAMPRPAGWLLDPLFGPDGTLTCGPHEDYTVLCSPTDPGGSQFSGGFDLFAAGVANPLDDMGPPYEVEAPIVLLNPAHPVYQGTFEGDLFNGGNHAYVATSLGGAPPAFEHQEFSETTSWGPAPTADRMVVSDAGVILLHDRSFPPAAVRFATFKAGGTRSPGNVGSYAVPGTNEPLIVFEPTELPALLGALPPPVNLRDLLTPVAEDPPDDPPDNTEPIDDTQPSDDIDDQGAEPDAADQASVPTTPASSGGGSNRVPILTLTAGGALLLGGGAATLIGRKRRRELAIPQGSLGAGYSHFEDEEPDSVRITPEDLQQYSELGMDWAAGAAATPTGPDEDWRLVVHREGAVQKNLAEQWLAGRKDLAEAFTAYETAMRTFKENAVLVMSATTVLDGLLAQGTENVETAKTVDFVWGVGQLGLAGVRFAVARWFTTPPHIPWAAVDDAAEAAAATSAGAAGVPREFARGYIRAAEEMDTSILAKLAEEAGVDLPRFVAGFDDAADASRALVEAVARRRGLVPINTDAEVAIRRLLDAGNSTLGTSAAHIDPADLNRLMRWADDVPDFWTRIERAAGWEELDGWFRMGDIPLGGNFGVETQQVFLKLFSADDIAFLRALVERVRKQEACPHRGLVRRAAGGTAGGPGSRSRAPTGSEPPPRHRDPPCCPARLRDCLESKFPVRSHPHQRRHPQRFLHHHPSFPGGGIHRLRAASMAYFQAREGP